MLGAVHEHGVQLRVVDAPRPPADVLAGLRTKVAVEGLIDAAVVSKSHARCRKVRSLPARDVGETAAPRQRPESVACAVLVDERLKQNGADLEAVRC